MRLSVLSTVAPTCHPDGSVARLCLFPPRSGGRDAHRGTCFFFVLLHHVRSFGLLDRSAMAAIANPLEPEYAERRSKESFGTVTLNKTFSVNSIRFGANAPLFVIAGPCVIESESQALRMAESLGAVASELGVPYVFKASYDKGNRTSLSSYRGPGLKKGLAILKNIKKKTGLPILTDVHDVSQVAPAAEVCDILQIPAFLCRQTDLLVAAGRSGRVVNVKKGQFLSPWEIGNAAEKIASTGNEKIILTERGSSFGYQNLVVDMRSFPIMRKFGYPVVFDVTHAVQLPGGEGKSSGGQPEFIEPLARAGTAAGVDGLFLEVHDNPAKALSDGSNALPLAQFRPLLEKILKLATLVREWNSK